MKTRFLLSILFAFMGAQLSAQYPEVPNFTAQLQGYNIARLTWETPIVANETVFFEGFETGNIPATWTVIDNDGDGEKWEIHPSSWSAAHTGNYSVASYSWFNGNVLTPDNWLISPEIVVPANAQLEFWVSGISPSYTHEHYQVRVSTSGSNIADFSQILIDETLPQNNNTWQERTTSLAAFGGQTIRLAFVHNNSTNVFALKIDDIGVKVYPKNDPELTGFTISRMLAGQDQFVTLTTLEPSAVEYFDNLTTEGCTRYRIKANYSDGESSNESATREVRFIDWYPATTLTQGTLLDGVLSLVWNHQTNVVKTLIAESFEAPGNLTGWTLTDNDGDFEQWEIHTATAAYHGSQSMASYSWFNGSVLTPDNWAISARQPLKGISANLSWLVSAVTSSHTAEHYQVSISNQPEAETTDFSVLFEETLTPSDLTWKHRSVTLTDFISDSVFVAFVHNQSTNQFALKVDSVSLRTYNSVTVYRIMTSSEENGAFSQFAEVDASGFTGTATFSDSYSESGPVWAKIVAVFADGGLSVLNHAYRIDPTSGMQMVAKPYKLLPNPANERLILEPSFDLAGRKGVVSIVNLAGSEVFSEPFVGATMEIGVSTLPVGVYTVMIKTDEGLFYDKIVIGR